MKRCFFVFLLDLLLSSCINKGVELCNISYEKCIPLNIASQIGNDVLDVSDLAYDISVVKLETTDESLIGNCPTVEYGRNRIYIYDVYGITIFDYQGKFINRLKNGQGPGELSGINNIVYDDVFDNLYVCLATGINKYDCNGVYIDSYPLKKVLTDFAIVSDGCFAVSKETQNSDHKYLLYRLDSNFNFIDNRTKAISDNIVPPLWINHIITHTLNDEYIIVRPFDNIIYSYSPYNDSVKAKYAINLGDKLLDVSSINDPYATDALLDLEKSHESTISYYGAYYETNNYVYLSFKRGSYLFIDLYYNKSTGNVRSGYKFENPVPNVPNIGYINGVHDNHFALFLSPHNDVFDTTFFQNVILSDKLSETDKQFLLNSSAEDNPLIIFYKLKDIPIESE